MKKILLTSCVLLLASCSNFSNKSHQKPMVGESSPLENTRNIASTVKGELVLKGNRTSYDSCSMPYGYAVDSDVITQIQSKDVFFRIAPGNGDFYPSVVITHVDKRGMAHSNPIQLDRCELVKKCIDNFANENLGIAASCDSENVLRVDFYQR